MLRSGKTLWIAFGAAALAAAAGPAGACDVPVFQYALQLWAPDRYEAVVFHRGELTAAQGRAVAALRQAADGPGRANLALSAVDVSDSMTPAIRALWQNLGGPAMPRVVLTLPRRDGGRAAVWSGPLTTAAARAIVDSPARRQIARRLLDGESAVWVLLECGDRPKDRAAAGTLAKELAAMPQKLSLPEPAEPAVAEASDGPAPRPPRIAFSVLRLSRTDPAERVLVAMLLRSEDDLETQFASEPMAFPIFGRGRALYAVIGKGLTAENILAACRFLTGPCACEVKAQNPGTDLLISAAWDELAPAGPLEDVELPPLTGLAAQVEAGRGERAAEAAPEQRPEPGLSSGSARAADKTSASLDADPSAGLLTVTLVALAAVAIAAVVLVAILRARSAAK